MPLQATIRYLTVTAMADSRSNETDVTARHPALTLQQLLTLTRSRSSSNADAALRTVVVQAPCCAPARRCVALPSRVKREYVRMASRGRDEPVAAPPSCCCAACCLLLCRCRSCGSDADAERPSCRPRSCRVIELRAVCPWRRSQRSRLRATCAGAGAHAAVRRTRPGPQVENAVAPAVASRHHHPRRRRSRSSRPRRAGARAGRGNRCYRRRQHCQVPRHPATSAPLRLAATTLPTIAARAGGGTTGARRSYQPMPEIPEITAAFSGSMRSPSCLFHVHPDAQRRGRASRGDRRSRAAPALLRVSSADASSRRLTTLKPVASMLELLVPVQCDDPRRATVAAVQTRDRVRQNS